MIVDRTDLDLFRDHIFNEKNTPGDWYTTGKFGALTTTLVIKISQDGNPRAKATLKHLSAGTQRWWDLISICSKLSWMKDLRDQGQLHELTWHAYAVSDIRAFFDAARSLMDHLSQALVASCQRQGIFRSHSFSDLVTWIKKNPDQAERHLSRNACAVFLGATWFEELKDLRDALTHTDRLALVLPREPNISLILRDGNKSVSTDIELMDTGDSIHFELFAAAILARIFALKEKVADVIEANLNVTDTYSKTRSGSSGLAVVKQWLDNLITNLESFPNIASE